MVGVGTAPGAVLLQFQPVSGVRFVLGCHIVAPLALVTGESQRRSFVTGHVSLTRFTRSQYSVFSTQYSVLLGTGYWVLGTEVALRAT